ncbi:uncharacterized protein [Rutidosis leptorrhynchoides]|uniref:uncharacterized protein isoform X2 n=1 Tax=Rutidosis leptorrhynchoides TaxID=125765 RepID=UPI003A98CE61
MVGTFFRRTMKVSSNKKKTKRVHKDKQGIHSKQQNQGYLAADAPVLNEEREKRILVSNLRMSTKKDQVCAYFENMKVKVNKINMNAFNRTIYNRSCTVFLSEAEATRVLKRTQHMIDGAIVTVQIYKGERNHPEVFKWGKYPLQIEGLEESSTAYMLHTKVEDMFLNRVRYSFMDIDPRNLTSVEVFFNNDAEREKAWEIVN